MTSRGEVRLRATVHEAAAMAAEAAVADLIKERRFIGFPVNRFTVLKHSS